jgi:hypothetical protein
MAQPATVKGTATHSHTVKGKAEPCSLPVFGPFGDKALHGSALLYGKADSNPEKRKPDAPPQKYDDWCFSYWTPANDAELVNFVKAKPANVRLLVSTALKSKARFDSWHENRGGTTTMWASIMGTPAARISKDAFAKMQAAGVDVKEVVKQGK